MTSGAPCQGARCLPRGRLALALLAALLLGACSERPEPGIHGDGGRDGGSRAAHDDVVDALQPAGSRSLSAEETSPREDDTHRARADVDCVGAVSRERAKQSALQAEASGLEIDESAGRRILRMERGSPAALWERLGVHLRRDGSCFWVLELGLSGHFQPPPPPEPATTMPGREGPQPVTWALVVVDAATGVAHIDALGLAASPRAGSRAIRPAGCEDALALDEVRVHARVQASRLLGGGRSFVFVKHDLDTPGVIEARYGLDGDGAEGCVWFVELREAHPDEAGVGAVAAPPPRVRMLLEGATGAFIASEGSA